MQFQLDFYTQLWIKFDFSQPNKSTMLIKIRNIMDLIWFFNYYNVSISDNWNVLLLSSPSLML